MLVGSVLPSDVASLAEEAGAPKLDFVAHVTAGVYPGIVFVGMGPALLNGRDVRVVVVPGPYLARANCESVLTDCSYG